MSAFYYADDHKGKYLWKMTTPAPGPMPYPMSYFRVGQPREHDYRIFFDGYLDGFHVERLGFWMRQHDTVPEILYCPSSIKNAKFFLTYGNTWPTNKDVPGGFQLFMTSYQYFNMGEMKDPPPGSSYRGFARWLSKSDKMPTKYSDPGYLSLFGDIIEMRRIGHDEYWRIANHTKHGAKEYFEDDPDGMNVARIDGSVEWYNHASGHTEQFWAYTNYGEYYYWGDPDR